MPPIMRVMHLLRCPADYFQDQDQEKVETVKEVVKKAEKEAELRQKKRTKRARVLKNCGAGGHE